MPANQPACGGEDTTTSPTRVFGDLLRAHRQAAGLTQEQLAECANLSARAVGDLERGANLRPHRTTIQLLIGALGLTGEQRSDFELAARNSTRAPLPEPDPLAVPASAPPSGRPCHNLPAPLTSFIGRTPELAEVTQRVRSQRLVTLTGVGGVGKTRLATEVGIQAVQSSGQSAFVDGVWFVELAELSQAALIPQALVQTFRLTYQIGHTPLDQLMEYLADKHLLLILDNCEHLIDACAEIVERLLRHCWQLHVLATSREELRIPGETTYALLPLRLANPLEDNPERLLASAAMQLFVERTGAGQFAQQAYLENANTITSICRQLDGIPLAIELAAPLARTMSLDEIAAQLHNQMAVLTNTYRNAIPRHQTMHSAMTWSYRLLAPSEQQVLDRVSVFAGGWTLEAAQAICGGEKAELLLSFQQLVAKSLVVAENLGEQRRYRLLEPVRQFARAHLTASGEQEAVCRRHAVYLAELAAQADAMLPTPERRPWMARLDAERENIRAALSWCLDGEGDRGVGMRLAGALVWHWRRGDPFEGRTWLQKAASVTEPGIRNGNAAGTGGSTDGSGDPELLELLGWCQAGAALLAWLNFEREEARTGLKEAIGLLRRSPNRLKLAHALGWLGMVESDLGRYPPAQEALDEALTIFVELGHDWDRGMGLQYSGISEIQAWLTGGSRETALRDLEESYKIFVLVGDDWARAETINPLASVTVEMGNYATALSLLEEGLRLARQEESPFAVAVALFSLAWFKHVHGAYEEAIPVFQEALAIRRELGDRLTAASIVDLIGFGMMATGHLEQARTMCEESLAVFRQLNNIPCTCWAMRNLASVSRLSGEPAKALELYEGALDIFKGKDSPWFHLICLLDLVALLGPSCEPQTAATLLGAADAVEKSMPNFWWPDTHPNFDRVIKAENVEAARAELGAESFALAWNAGHKIHAEQAIALAIAAVHRRLTVGGEG